MTQKKRLSSVKKPVFTVRRIRSGNPPKRYFKDIFFAKIASLIFIGAVFLTCAITIHAYQKTHSAEGLLADISLSQLQTEEGFAHAVSVLKKHNAGGFDPLPATEAIPLKAGFLESMKGLFSGIGDFISGIFSSNSASQTQAVGGAASDIASKEQALIGMYEQWSGLQATIDGLDAAQNSCGDSVSCWTSVKKESDEMIAEADELYKKIDSTQKELGQLYDIRETERLSVLEDISSETDSGQAEKTEDILEKIQTLDTGTYELISQLNGKEAELSELIRKGVVSNAKAQAYNCDSQGKYDKSTCEAKKKISKAAVDQATQRLEANKDLILSYRDVLNKNVTTRKQTLEGFFQRCDENATGSMLAVCNRVSTILKGVESFESTNEAELVYQYIDQAKKAYLTYQKEMDRKVAGMMDSAINSAQKKDACSGLKSEEKTLCERKLAEKSASDANDITDAGRAAEAQWRALHVYLLGGVVRGDTEGSETFLYSEGSIRNAGSDSYDFAIIGSTLTGSATASAQLPAARGTSELKTLKDIFERQCEEGSGNVADDAALRSTENCSKTLSAIKAIDAYAGWYRKQRAQFLYTAWNALKGVIDVAETADADLAQMMQEVNEQYVCEDKPYTQKANCYFEKKRAYKAIADGRKFVQELQGGMEGIFDEVHTYYSAEALLMRNASDMCMSGNGNGTLIYGEASCSAALETLSILHGGRDEAGAIDMLNKKEVVFGLRSTVLADLAEEFGGSKDEYNATLKDLANALVKYNEARVTFSTTDKFYQQCVIGLGGDKNAEESCQKQFKSQRESAQSSLEEAEFDLWTGYQSIYSLLDITKAALVKAQLDIATVDRTQPVPQIWQPAGEDLVNAAKDADKNGSWNAFGRELKESLFKGTERIGIIIFGKQYKKEGEVTSVPKDHFLYIETKREILAERQESLENLQRSIEKDLESVWNDKRAAKLDIFQKLVRQTIREELPGADLEAKRLEIDEDIAAKKADKEKAQRALERCGRAPQEDGACDQEGIAWRDSVLAYNTAAMAYDEIVSEVAVPSKVYLEATTKQTQFYIDKGLFYPHSFTVYRDYILDNWSTESDASSTGVGTQPVTGASLLHFFKAQATVTTTSTVPEFFKTLTAEADNPTWGDISAPHTIATAPSDEAFVSQFNYGATGSAEAVTDVQEIPGLFVREGEAQGMGQLEPIDLHQDKAEAFIAELSRYGTQLDATISSITETIIPTLTKEAERDETNRRQLAGCAATGAGTGINALSRGVLGAISSLQIAWPGGNVQIGATSPCTVGPVINGPGASAGLNMFAGTYAGNTYGSAIGQITGWTNFAIYFIGAIAIAALVYAGYLYITAGVSEENVDKAKKIVIYVVIGIVLVFMAYAIVNTVLSGDAST